LDKAADRLRESAKWLVAAFGAVAAVIFTGLTVTDLGELKGDTAGYRLPLAIIGAGAAMFGIIVALSQAMRLAGASTTSLDDLTRDLRPWELSLRDTREELKRDPVLTTWGGDISAFIEEYNKAYDAYIQETEAYASDLAGQPDASQVKKAVYRLRVMSGIASRLLRTTSFLRLQRSFVRTRASIAALMALSAAGAITFGWSTSSLPEQPPELPARLVAGTLRPDGVVLKELNRQTTARCQLAEEDIPVIVLDDDDNKLRIVTVPAEACQPLTASVPKTQVTK
jgi:hypothetical protein